MGSGNGLRERKKQRTRWAIQEHALRLFAEQGYDETTVEQIAAAAEVSPSTFFRYFRTKEDVVVQDEYDPLMAELVRTAPAGERPLPTLRRAIATAFSELEPAEVAKIRERARLVLAVPALRSRTLQTFVDSIEVVAEPLALRLGRDPRDLGTRAIVGACMGACLVAIQEWIDDGAHGDLAALIDQALAAVEAAGVG